MFDRHQCWMWRYYQQPFKTTFWEKVGPKSSPNFRGELGSNIEPKLKVVFGPTLKGHRPFITRPQAELLCVSLTFAFSFYSLYYKMDNIFLNAGIIAVVYLLLRFAEMRIVLKESKPLKELAKDTLLVYFSIVLGIYVIEQVIPGESGGNKVIGAFTDAPGF